MSLLSKNILRSISCRHNPHNITATILWKCLFKCYQVRCIAVSTAVRKVNAPVFLEAQKHEKKTAILDQNGVHTYKDLICRSTNLVNKIKQVSGVSIFKNHERVAYLCDNDACYVWIQWAIWMMSGIAVPLCKTHPSSELKYFIDNSSPTLVIISQEFQHIAEELESMVDPKIKFMIVNSKEEEAGALESEIKSKYEDCIQNTVSDNHQSQPALIVYTTGTTGRPKGVVYTHGNLYSQMSGMIESWGWTNQDIVLHVLPLHHVHGIVNVLMTSLYVGATCVMVPKFDSEKVWCRLIQPIKELDNIQINLFMAVPTVYAKLIQFYNKSYKQISVQDNIKHVCQNQIRLMVSGSSALPQPVMQRWEEITGHKLLERYGMTEIGMALSNPLHGPRIPGCVGSPMPNVEVCVVKDDGSSDNIYRVLVQGNSQQSTISPGTEDEIGELLVKGPNVFSQYWNKPEATKEAFTPDGYFKTGDAAVYQNGVYKIIGRLSVDIIKSGGFKIGALDIERHLLAHPDVEDCAIIGVPDPTYGQRVAAVLVLSEQKEITLKELNQWCSDKMPKYQIPTVLKIVETMPRNPMGKVNKKELVADLFPEYSE